MKVGVLFLSGGRAVMIFYSHSIIEHKANKKFGAHRAPLSLHHSTARESLTVSPRQDAVALEQGVMPRTH